MMAPPIVPHMQVSQDIMNFLRDRPIRTLDDMLDLQSLLLAEVLMGNIPMAMSERIRKWAELMMATTAAKMPKQSTNLNLSNNINLSPIEQFMQIDQVMTQAAIVQQQQPRQIPVSPPRQLIEYEEPKPIPIAPELELSFEDE